MIPFIIIVAFIPGLFWLFYFIKKDKYEPEPPLFIIYVFIAGMVAILPAGIIERFFHQLISNKYIYYIFIVGLSEETVKFLSVRLTVFRNREFDEPIDGIVYSTTAALGFATVENILYMMTMGWKVIFVRAVFSTLGHIVFAALWGYPLYKSKKTGKKRYVVFGLLMAALMHGLYNIFIISAQLYGLLLAVAIIIILYCLMNRDIKKAEEESPYKK